MYADHSRILFHCNFHLHLKHILAHLGCKGHSLELVPSFVLITMSLLLASVRCTWKNPLRASAFVKATIPANWWVSSSTVWGLWFSWIMALLRSWHGLTSVGLTRCVSGSWLYLWLQNVFVVPCSQWLLWWLPWIQLAPSFLYVVLAVAGSTLHVIFSFYWAKPVKELG